MIIIFIKLTQLTIINLLQWIAQQIVGGVHKPSREIRRIEKNQFVSRQLGIKSDGGAVEREITAVLLLLLLLESN